MLKQLLKAPVFILCAGADLHSGNM